MMTIISGSELIQHKAELNEKILILVSNPSKKKCETRGVY